MPAVPRFELRFRHESPLDDRGVLEMLRFRMGRWRHSPRSEFLRRILAMGCAVLILALGVFAASPALHQQLHDGPHASAPDVCAVALFANGVSVALPLTALPPPSAQWSELPAAAARELFLDSPRYLLQPERGPPVA